VVKLETDLSRNYKDLIQKHASGVFRDATLEFYGIKTAKIKEFLNVELPEIKVRGSSTDFVFLLEDNSILHFEFVTTYNKSDLIRFAHYDLRLYEREDRRVYTVIIYSSGADVKTTGLNIGSFVYCPDIIMMVDYDGDEIYKELNQKISTGQELTDSDMLNLLFLPLMRNTIPRNELAINSVVLAQTIKNSIKREACVAAAFAFGSKFLNENEMKKLREVLKMDVLAELMEERMEERIQEREIELAKDMLKEDMPIETIARFVRLDESTIIQLKTELESE